MNVVLGCGRREFLPNSTLDQDGKPGSRLGNLNLIDEWLNQRKEKNAKYVTDSSGLAAVPDDTELLLGLFGNDHCEYNLDRDPIKQPSLADKTEAAIKVRNVVPSQNLHFIYKLLFNFRCMYVGGYVR